MGAEKIKMTENDLISMFPDKVSHSETSKNELRKIPKAQTFNRMLAHGIDHTDYSKIVERVSSGEDYVKVCEELGDTSYDYAIEELRKGHKHTARIFFTKASALYRVGPYEIVTFTEEKTRIYKKEMDSFARAMALYENMRAEKIQIPYKSSKMTGWMCIPKGASEDVPVIVMICGLTGFKEELHFMAMKLVDRGFAVLNIDGPGQGETYYENHCYFEIEIRKAYGVILNYILNRNDVGNKIGLYGLCLGGHFAAKVAGLFPDKVAACVCNGGSYLAKEAMRFNREFLDTFTVRYGKNQSEREELRVLAPQFTLEGIASQIRCPLLIIHNDPDPLIRVKNIQKLYDEAASKDKTMKVYPGPDHCAYNNNTEVTSYVTDWLSDRLLV